MEVRWVPYSAGLLATGALAVLCAALITPTGNAAESLSVVEDNDGRWLLACVMYLLASFALTLGLPAVYDLLRGRFPRFGLMAVGIFAIGTIATCGYAMLLVFYRALVLTEALRGPVDGLTGDVGIAAFLAILIGSFYLGETLLAIALLRMRTVPRWVPVVLGLHVLSLALTPILPMQWQNVPTVLLAAGLCGVAIEANDASHQRWARLG